MPITPYYYNGDIDNIAYSVPATEHSVMTAEGPEGEKSVLKRVLDAYTTGIVSIVSDSYNIVNFIENYIGKDFKEQILARDGKVVARPDSLRSEDDTPHEQMVWIAKALWDAFGGIINSKGYKVLNPHIGMIWGDGIDAEGIEWILAALEEAGFSTENAVFGMGGGLLQKINRDTQRFAFKCSARKRGGKWIDISKNPLDASKASKKGRLKLISVEGDMATVNESIEGEDLLRTVFENGEVVQEYTFEELRKNASI